MFLKIDQKGIFFVSISQFGMALSFSFVMTFLPFYIAKISPYSPKETMIWTGLIIGPSHILTALAAPFWGSLTSRYSPKLLFERGMLSNGVLFLIMGFVSNLPIFLILRMIQGALGGVSTIGLILISSMSKEERLHKDFSFFQNSITAGQLIGPLLGAYTASLFGYRTAFIFAFIIATIFLVFCHQNVEKIPVQKKVFVTEINLKRSLIWAWFLSFTATIHLTFLISILPTILKGFQLTDKVAIKSAGFIIILYTISAIIGNYSLSSIASKFGLRKVIILACLLASLFQFLLYFSPGVVSFTVFRMIQTGFIASVFPLTLSIFGREIGGRTVGFMNSSRFVGMAIGPIMATSIMAYSNLLTLSAIITVITFISLLGFVISIDEKTLLPNR